MIGFIDILNKFPLIFKFVKFTIVGGTTFFIDIGLTYFTKEKFGIHKLLANAVGYITAALVNFFWNKFWTFHNQEANFGIQLLKFGFIASGALALSTGLIYILNEKLRINFYVSKLVAVLLVMFYNFVMNSLFTFRQ
ncbi:MAG: GtrA family protein [Chitinophagales bacterium]|jgi:putative flippase GtrA|nr:GtrA family protein [Chitinophagales bacterium]